MVAASEFEARRLAVLSGAIGFWMLALLLRLSRKRRGPGKSTGFFTSFSPGSRGSWIRTADARTTLSNQLAGEHPEGPNLGYGSNTSWLDADRNCATKTDLLHKGHIKGGKLLICVIGLPARGKTYIARKVARYLRWINYRTRVFCLARYRQDKYGHKQPAEFFDTTNAEYASSRAELVTLALEDLVGYLNRGGEVAILDGSQCTIARRNMIIERIKKEDGYEILWLESICSDPSVIAHNIAHLREASPDYVAVQDFERRIMYYQRDYVSVRESEGAFAKIFDAGRKLELHDIHGFLPTKIIAFIMNLHTLPRPVYFTRHGESTFNCEGLIGGDSALSEKGERFSEVLAMFIAEQLDLSASNLSVWSSTMKRSRQTARRIKCAKYVEWRSLREIEVGVCDGMTYEQVKEKFPQEFKSRESDKLRYRYPRGESYMDVISRLEPVIFELERQQDPVLIIGHQAVLRALYSYFLDLPPEEIPYLSIPLHTIIKVLPRAYGCSEKRYRMAIDSRSGTRIE